MRISRRASCALIVVCLGISGAFATPIAAQEFGFRLEAPVELHDHEIFELRCVLDSAQLAERGAEAWELGVRHEKLDLLEVTTRGTIVDTFFDNGFEFTEITTGAGNEGFTSAVILSLEDQVSLPEIPSALLVRASYQVRTSTCFGEASIAVFDGLEGSRVEPTINSVSYLGQTFTPAADRIDYSGCVLNQYEFSIESSSNPLILQEDDGDQFDVDIVLEQEVHSAISWTIAVAHDDTDLNLLNVSLEDIAPWIADDGFTQIELTGGAGNTGFVAHFEISAAEPLVLPVLRQVVATATYQTARPLETGDVETRIRFAESLRSSGGTTRNDLRPRGDLELRSLDLTVKRFRIDPLLRADTNGDGSVDIGDPVSGLTFLFLGRGTICAEAADSNSSGSLDLSDAIFTLRYLFLGGPAPPFPFPDCAPPLESAGCDVSACS